MTSLRDGSYQQCSFLPFQKENIIYSWSSGNFLFSLKLFYYRTLFIIILLYDSENDSYENRQDVINEEFLILIKKLE